MVKKPMMKGKVREREEKEKFEEKGRESRGGKEGC